MITVLEEQQTGLTRNGLCLARRVYLASGTDDMLPTDAAPGSLALVREGERVHIRILFPDGSWGRL